MKRLVPALLAVFFSAAVFAQAVHHATGVVTRVDAAKGKVTIKHDPVQSLNWPGMTMAFTVKDNAMLDKLSKGKKIAFDFKEEGKDYVITSVK